MKAELRINDYNVTPWLAENGLKQTEIIRIGRSVVTLDGIKQQSQVIKRGLEASFVGMRDTSWYAIKSTLANRLVTVRYIDDDLGPRVAEFWVLSASAAAKKVTGGITYFSGCSVSLEER